MNDSETYLEKIKYKFGFVIQSHRIGELNLKVAQIDRIDDMVKEIYPDALTKHGDAPVWLLTWPGSFALAEYLLNNYSMEGKRVLELGCGTAATGIALERAGAKVVCTDYDPLALEMARYNARLNGCREISMCMLDWYSPEIEGQFDLIVGSEVVYFEKTFDSIINVLKKYSNPKGVIILSDQLRPQMISFLEKCTESGFMYHNDKQMVYLPNRDQPIRITILRPLHAL